MAETFSVAWQKLSQLPDPRRPWLLATARRVSANHIRARRKRLANEISDLDEALGRMDLRSPTASYGGSGSYFVEQSAPLGNCLMTFTQIGDAYEHFGGHVQTS